MLAFETIIRYAFREMPLTERQSIWEEIKGNMNDLHLLDTVETLKERHGLKSSAQFNEWIGKHSTNIDKITGDIIRQEITFSKLIESVSGILNPSKDDLDDLLDFLPKKSKIPVSFGSNEEVDEEKVEKLTLSLKGQNIEQVRRLYVASNEIARRAIIQAILKICAPPKNDLTIEHLKRLLKQYLGQESNDSDTPSIWMDYFVSNPVL